MKSEQKIKLKKYTSLLTTLCLTNVITFRCKFDIYHQILTILAEVSLKSKILKDTLFSTSQFTYLMPLQYSEKQTRNYICFLLSNNISFIFFGLVRKYLCRTFIFWFG